ncbi:MAG: helix-turn-helix domain-containing protein [bacterium]|nr:helix-turn-helix domain-containing protein [bacterium]
MAELDQNIAKKLKKSGLTNKEAEVYAALLSLGGGFPSKVAEETALNRSTVYKVLDNLAIKGLVSEVEKRNKLFYQVENPRNVERYAQSRITIAKRQLESTQDLLPILEGLYKHSANKPIVRFFEGRDGVLQVYSDHVAGKKAYEMLAWSNTAELVKFLPEKFIRDYVKRKEKIGVTARGILPDTEVDINYNETVYKYVSKKVWPKIRNISNKVFPYQADITIYAENKVSIINFTRGTLAATIIEDKTIHDMMVMIFELAWQGVDLAAQKNRQDKK